MEFSPGQMGNPVSLFGNMEADFGIPKALIDQLPKRETGIVGKMA
jgi:hypothetical protein